MQRHPLIVAMSLGLFAGAATTAVLADTSPLEQQQGPRMMARCVVARVPPLPIAASWARSMSSGRMVAPQISRRTSRISAECRSRGRSKDGRRS